MPVRGVRTKKQFQKSVTMGVPTFAIPLGEIIALSSSFETKVVGNTQLVNGQFRDTLVFVLLNQYADNFHERSERVRLVFSDFID